MKIKVDSKTVQITATKENVEEAMGMPIPDPVWDKAILDLSMHQDETPLYRSWDIIENAVLRAEQEINHKQHDAEFGTPTKGGDA